MAVPTITSLTPDAGLTVGGNVVDIIGTNFRLPPAPPADGYLGGDAQQTVSVMFEGVEAPFAASVSDTRVIARVPEWVGAYDVLPATLDVRVANLDDSGVEIPGENVTSADAYTIARQSFQIEETLQRVCRELISVFRRHVLENTHISMSRDFDDEVGTQQREIADAPVVYLVGPDTPTNRLRTLNRLDSYEDPTEVLSYLRNQVPSVNDLLFEIIVYAVGNGQLLGLQQEIMLLFRDVPYLNVGTQKIEMRMPFNGFPRIQNVPNLSDLYSFRANMALKGVCLDRTSRTIIERGWDVYDNDGEPIVDTQTV